jgi:hypothetical protein
MSDKTGFEGKAKLRREKRESKRERNFHGGSLEDYDNSMETTLSSGATQPIKLEKLTQTPAKLIPLENGDVSTDLIVDSGTTQKIEVQKKEDIEKETISPAFIEQTVALVFSSQEVKKIIKEITKVNITPVGNTISILIDATVQNEKEDNISLKLNLKNSVNGSLEIISGIPTSSLSKKEIPRFKKELDLEIKKIPEIMESELEKKHGKVEKMEIKNGRLKVIFGHREFSDFIPKQTPTPETQPKPVYELRTLQTGRLNTLPESGLRTLPKSEILPPQVTPEEKVVEKEYKKLPEEDKEKIGWGIGVIGLRIERKKNIWLAKTLGWTLKKLEIDNKGTTGRFVKELANSFTREAKNAEQKAKEATSGRAKHTLSKIAGWGNLVKYGRLLADATGMTVGAANRLAMMGSMAFTKIAEAGKEARFKNEEVLEKTRIQDVEKAYDEAMRIYERAIAKTGGNKEDGSTISTEALKNAYLMEMPKDLHERLKIPSTANSFIQEIIKGDLAGAIARLNIKIEKIEGNKKLSLEQKTRKVEALLLTQRKNLEDYDRIITQYGTVDGLALTGYYAQKAGKAAVATMQVQTLILSAEKLWGTVSEILSKSHEVHEIIPSSGGKILDTAHQAPAGVANKTVENFNFKLNPDAVVHKSEGIETVLRRQIEHDSEFAKSLGWKEGMDIHKFSGGAAHKMAIDYGYVDKTTGEQIFVREAGVAYQIDPKSGKIFEVGTDGKITEQHVKGDVFEQDIEKYEYKSLNEHHKTINHNEITSQNVTPEQHLSSESEVNQNPVASRKSFIELEKEMQRENHSKSIFKPEDDQSNSNTAEELKTKIVEKINKAGSQNIIRTGQEMNTGSDYERMLNSGGYSVIRHHEDIFPDLSHSDNVILERQPDFADNNFNLKGNDLMRAYDTHEHNIKALFQNHDKVENWEDMKRWNTDVFLNENSSYQNEPIAVYIKHLREVTGLKPKKGFLWISPEKTESYIARALQKAAQIGKLSQLKIQE